MGAFKPAKSPKISTQDTLNIFIWVHGSTSLTAKDMTKEDRGYAQTMLVEMLDARFAVGFVEALFRSVAKLPKGPKAVIKSFLKGANKSLVKDKDDLKEMMKKPVIYKMIYNTVKLKTKSPWKIRETTGSW